MFGKVEQSLSVANDSKAFTLPNNFAPSSQACFIFCCLCLFVSVQASFFEEVFGVVSVQASFFIEVVGLV
jgi:hypothetical protein